MYIIHLKLGLYRLGRASSFLLCLETWSYSVTQTGLELLAVLLPYPPKCWLYTREPQAPFFFLLPLKEKIYTFSVNSSAVPFGSFCNHLRMLP